MTDAIKISLLVPVRITEEKFSNFLRFLQSVYDCANNLGTVEVLIKFDDDQDLSKALEIIEQYKSKGLKIKHLISPRGRGYAYFSYFMNDLIFLSDPSSKAFCHLTIDFKFIRKGFDDLWINSMNKYEDGIFVIHQQFCGSFIDTIKDVNTSFQLVENAPVVSRKWLEIQSTYGYSSSCDGYIGMVEYFLFFDYGIDRRIDLSHDRCTTETDCLPVDSDYWSGPRRKAMETHLQYQSISFAKQAAKNLAMNISNSWKKDDYTEHLIKSCLNAYDRTIALEARIRELSLDIETLNSSVALANLRAKPHKEKKFLRKIEKKVKKKKHKLFAALGLKSSQEKLKNWRGYNF